MTETDLIIKEVERDFKKRVEFQEIKPKSKRFYVMQCEFFMGAASVLIAAGILKGVPIKWSICVMGSRSVIEL
jgi:hypothetical protein